MPKCSYCGKEYKFPRGMTVVKNSGNPAYFCSSKCRKNKKMGKRKARWILKSKKVKQKA